MLLVGVNSAGGRVQVRRPLRLGCGGQRLLQRGGVLGAEPGQLAGVLLPQPLDRGAMSTATLVQLPAQRRERGLQGVDLTAVPVPDGGQRGVGTLALAGTVTV